MKSWATSDYCFHVGNLDVNGVAEAVFEKVFRTSFDQPGFAIVSLGAVDSHQQRRAMVDLKESLSRLHEEHWQERLHYLSLGRFDQQASTKLHLDGAPARSFLMLGYEPTEVRSQFLISDFTLCAHELGISSTDFLQRHNPMFGPGADMLRNYTTTITGWHEDRPRIVVINNSIGSTSDGIPMLGVMHGASIPEPKPHLQRIINSTMIAPACYAANDGELQVTEFVTTTRVSGPIVTPANS